MVDEEASRKAGQRQTLPRRGGPEALLTRVVSQPTMGVCPIPKILVPWFGKTPSKITLLNNTRCKWDVKTKFVVEKAIIDQGGHPLSLPIILGLDTSSSATRKLWASTEWLSSTTLVVR
jgi:hypothetical protein